MQFLVKDHLYTYQANQTIDIREKWYNNGSPNLYISRVCWVYSRDIKVAAVVIYCKALITKSMESAGAPEGWKIDLCFLAQNAT